MNPELLPSLFWVSWNAYQPPLSNYHPQGTDANSRFTICLLVHALCTNDGTMNYSYAGKQTWLLYWIYPIVSNLFLFSLATYNSRGKSHIFFADLLIALLSRAEPTCWGYDESAVVQTLRGRAVRFLSCLKWRLTVSPALVHSQWAELLKPRLLLLGARRPLPSGTYPTGSMNSIVIFKRKSKYQSKKNDIYFYTFVDLRFAFPYVQASQTVLWYMNYDYMSMASKQIKEATDNLRAPSGSRWDHWLVSVLQTLQQQDVSKDAAGTFPQSSRGKLTTPL